MAAFIPLASPIVPVGAPSAVFVANACSTSGSLAGKCSTSETAANGGFSASAPRRFFGEAQTVLQYAEKQVFRFSARRATRLDSLPSHSTVIHATATSEPALDEAAERKSIRFQQHPLIKRLAETIEEVWATELDLAPYQLPDEFGIVEGRLEGERLVIENKCFQSRVFRKMHLELARVGNVLDILHVVMFPRPEYDIPMFGADLVGGRGQLSACIVDLSPVTPDRSLPAGYTAAFEANPLYTFSEPRELPPWGHIFSDYCAFIRPHGDEEEEQFLNRVRFVLELHCRQAQATAASTELAAKEQTLAGQTRYCTQQQQNDKTRRVLEKAFGEEWADRYMTTVLFDLPTCV